MDMRRNIRVLIAAVLVLNSGLSTEQEFDWGVVTTVYDGDTIQVRLDSGASEKVRLLGIDTPEMGDERTMVRFQAETAKRFTYYSLFRRKVQLTYDWDKRDEYGRLLAYVRLPDGMFNEIILSRGYASAFLKYPFKNETMQRFKEAAAEAKETKKGLWKALPYPVIDSREAESFLGRMFAVKFRCEEIIRRREYILLRSNAGRFAAFIYRRDLTGFPDLAGLKNQQLIVSGMIEDYRGNPQMVLFFPFQLVRK
jgi:micrococcal nuclease